MYIGKQAGKIVLVADTRAELEHAPCMVFDEIVETDTKYELYEGEYFPEEIVKAKKAAAEQAAHRAELLAQLDELDLKAIRALRALSSGTGTAEDKAKLEALETEAAAVRAQLAEGA